MTLAEQRLRPYVAGLASEWLATTPDVTYKRITGSLAFVDISGFTKLTERLAARGKVGAEEMSDLLDKTFAELLRHAYSYGASLVKWGGDAVLLLFEDEGHAALAARAAYDMRLMMRSIGRLQTSAGAATLRMSVGIESGELDFFLVGEHHRELLVLGPVATATATMEAVAEAGEIALGPLAASLLPPSARGAVKETATLLATPPSPAMRSRVWLRRSPADGLARSLDPALARHLAAGTGDSEHRQVSAGFVEVRAVDALMAERGPEETAAALSRLISIVDEECARHHVTFWETDISPDGFKILLIGGAPSSSGHDEHAMVHAAHAIATRHDGPLRIRIGVNAGRVFCGNFGPAFRRTFSVKGDAINLAARVMGKAAPGQVLATQSVLTAAGDAFDVDPLPPFMVKGKSKPVHAAVVLRERDTSGRSEDAPFVGRAVELATLRQLWQAAIAGRGGSCTLLGAPGIGKSRLTAELTRDIADDAVWRTYCSDYDSATAYFPFRRLLRDLLAAGALDGEELVRVLAATVRDRAPQLTPWLPLLAVPLGLTMPATPETAALGEEFRRPQTERAVIELLAALLDGPALMVVENLEHIDDASLSLLRRIGRSARERSWLLLGTTRGEHGLAVDELALGPLGSDEARSLARATMTRPLAPHRLDTIVRRAEGNPLFVLELTAAASASKDGELPGTLEEMMAAQIDQLPSKDRDVLRAAAVLGQRFEWSRLDTVLGEPVPPRTRRRLQPYLRGDREAVFASAVVRVAAYEGLAFRRRVSLHAKTADLIRAETDQVDSVAEALSHHLLQAQRFDEAWRFARLAADRAFAVPAYVEASTLYDRAVTAGSKLASLDAHEIAHDLERSGEALFRIGETQAALDRFAAARRRVRGAPAVLARLELATARAAQRLNGADPSLRWLRRARRELGLAMSAGVAGADSERLRTVIEIEEAYARYTAGRLGAAQRWCHAAVEHARAIGDDVELARSLHLLDMILVASGAASDGSLAVEALDAATRAADNIRRCGILSQLGARAYYAGEWDLAISRYEQACEAGTRGGDVWLVAVVRSNIGEVMVEQGRFAEAEPILQEAVDVFRAADTPSPWAFAEVLLGRLCARSGRPQDSASHFDEADALYRRLHLDADLAELTLWRADAAVVRGDAAVALELLEDAPTGGSLALRTRGLALLRCKDVAGGTEVLRDAVIAARDGSPFELYCCLQALQRSPLISAAERAAARDEVTDLERRLSIVPALILPYDAPAEVSIPKQRADLPAAART